VEIRPDAVLLLFGPRQYPSNNRRDARKRSTVTEKDGYAVNHELVVRTPEEPTREPVSAVLCPIQDQNITTSDQRSNGKTL
jgi:hypothetical protein